MKREFAISESKINEMLEKKIDPSLDIEKVSTEIHPDYITIKLFTSFPTNPVICVELVPESIMDDGKMYKILLKKKSAIYIEGAESSPWGQALDRDKLNSFAEDKMNETDFISVKGDEITLKIEKDSDIGKYAEIAPELVAKAIATSSVICKEKELVVETEVSDIDIKAALFKKFMSGR